MKNNKKGFTLVELVLSVTLLSVVLIFMMSMLVDLKDKEASNGADAKLLVNQAIISKTVNTDIITYGLESISACASMNCFIFSYGNGEEKTLRLMSDNQTLFYGNDRTTEFIRTLPSGRKYSSIHYYIYANLEIVRISINKIYKNEDYDVEIYNYMGNKTTNTGGYAASGLILHYDALNNSGTGVHNSFSSQWMDLSGNGNNAELKNIDLTSTKTSGWIENGLVLDGIDDSLFLGDELKDVFKYSNTIEFVISKDDLNRRDILLSNCNEDNCNSLEVSENNKNNVKLNASTEDFLSDADVISSDNITTLAYVFDKSKGTITTFIDGLKGEVFTSEQLASYNYDFSNSWIGKSNESGQSFKGKIYSVRVYSYALSDTKLYSNATIDKNRFIKQYLYTYVSNDKQTFTPPVAGLYKIELWGASGGSIGSYKGGAGAYTAGTVELIQGENVFLYIGSQGQSGQTEGGYNGGGSVPEDQVSYGAPGGGATDVRILNGDWDEGASLNSRIMVAAGGGGANNRGENNGQGAGGAAGGLTGYSGESTSNTSGYGFSIGSGGTQISGGKNLITAGTGVSESQNVTGSFGKGGSNNQSGGGAGYYGGGNSFHGGAGGGSSYISGHKGCVAITAEYDPTPKENCEEGTENKTCSYHYSRKVFNDTIMIDGAGFKWSNNMENLEVMPNPEGGYYNLGKGNEGNGYVRITYLGQSA